MKFRFSRKKCQTPTCKNYHEIKPWDTEDRRKFCGKCYAKLAEAEAERWIKIKEARNNATI